MPRTGVMKDNSMRYRASKRDCEVCALKPRCCPHAPVRKISSLIYEGARDLARQIAKTEPYQTSRRQRKKVEMLFAHLKRILRLDRLRLRGPNGAIAPKMQFDNRTGESFLDQVVRGDDIADECAGIAPQVRGMDCDFLMNVGHARLPRCWSRLRLAGSDLRDRSRGKRDCGRLGNYLTTTSSPPIQADKYNIIKAFLLMR